MAEERFTLKIHHGGQLILFGANPSYVGGKIDFVEGIDPDLMSYFDMFSIIKDLGHPKSVTIYHLLPDTDIDGGLRQINGDIDVMDMFVIHAGSNTINMYIENLDNIDGLSVQVMNHGHNSSANMLNDERENVDDDKQIVDNINMFEVQLQEFVQDLDDTDYIISSEEDNSDISTPLSNLSGFDDEDDVNNCSVQANLKSDCDKAASFDLSMSPATVAITEMMVNDISSESDRQDSLINSEDEVNHAEFPIFNEERDMANPILKLGMIFRNVGIFRTALKENSIKNGYEFRYKKNEGNRVTAVCMDECPWRIHASKVHGTNTFQIKSLRNHVMHPKRYRNRNANSAWLAKTYMPRLIDDSTWKVKAIKSAARREHNLFVSRSQAYRAKRKALESIQGNHKEQYTRVRDYCHMLIQQNIGSLAFVSVNRPVPNSVAFFQRMFVMFDAQRRGFLSGCRPVIGLDACHLKGPFGGQLMHAIGIDGNNQMYPIAIAVVEAEVKDSWTWFLQILLRAIGRPEEMGWMFISDRQKGLTETFNLLMPEAEHRFCVRHLYANFKQLYKGQDLKDLLWGAASAYTIEEFNDYMNALRALNEPAYDWLMRESPSTWARSHFSARSKCDMVSNNISESFNQWIKDARDKPIITMMEMIRRQLMIRYQNQKEMMDKCTGVLCPKIVKKIESSKNEASKCEVILAGDSIFEVMQGVRNFVVDLGNRTCTCRKYDLSGIPCAHAIAAVMFSQGNVAELVNDYYKKEAYLRAYQGMIKPLPDQSQWSHSQGDPIVPPPLRRPPGRPKKARKKAVDEPRNPNVVRRVYQTLRCSNCARLGHNIRTCKGPVRTKQTKKNQTQGLNIAQDIGTGKSKASGTINDGVARKSGQRAKDKSIAVKPNLVTDTKSNAKSAANIRPAVGTHYATSTNHVIRKSSKFGDIFFSQGSTSSNSQAQSNHADIRPRQESTIRSMAHSSQIQSEYASF